MSARRKYCSPVCREAARTKTCVVCGDRYKKRSSSNATDWNASVTCSRVCAARKLSTDKTKPRAPCVQCGGHPAADSSRWKAHSQWCSQECGRAWRATRRAQPKQPNRECERCRQPFFTSNTRRRFCSNRCRGEADQVVVDVLGVSVTATELALVAGVSRAMVVKRVRVGLPVIWVPRKYDRWCENCGDRGHHKSACWKPQTVWNTAKPPVHGARGVLKVCGSCKGEGHNRRTCNANPTTT